LGGFDLCLKFYFMIKIKREILFRVYIFFLLLVFGWSGIWNSHTIERLILWSTDTRHWHADTASNLRNHIIMCNYICIHDTAHVRQWDTLNPRSVCALHEVMDSIMSEDVQPNNINIVTWARLQGLVPCGTNLSFRRKFD